MKSEHKITIHKVVEEDLSDIKISKVKTTEEILEPNPMYKLELANAVIFSTVVFSGILLYLITLYFKTWYIPAILFILICHFSYRLFLSRE